MTEPRARVIDGRKFMWDGRGYETQDDAERVRREYEAQQFDTRVVEEEGKVNIYTRRVVGTVAGPSEG